MSSKIEIKCDRCGEVFIQPVVYTRDDDDRVTMTNIEMTNWGTEDYEQLIAEVCPQCDPIVRHEFEIFLFKAGILK
jgi:uncharacterized C2H2 Zn-finger protein